MGLNYFNNKLILNKKIITEEETDTNIDAEKAITR